MSTTAYVLTENIEKKKNNVRAHLFKTNDVIG